MEGASYGSLPNSWSTFSKWKTNSEEKRHLSLIFMTRKHTQPREVVDQCPLEYSGCVFHVMLCCALRCYFYGPMIVLYGRQLNSEDSGIRSSIACITVIPLKYKVFNLKGTFHCLHLLIILWPISSHYSKYNWLTDFLFNLSSWLDSSIWRNCWCLTSS